MSKSQQGSTPIDQRLVTISGEMDIAAGNELALAGAGDVARDVVVDISAVTFMDCSGYRSIVAARLAQEARGGSLALRCATGQPRSLLRMIEDLGRKSA